MEWIERQRETGMGGWGERENENGIEEEIRCSGRAGAGLID